MKSIPAGVAIALAVLAAYANAFATPFVYDDIPSIVLNSTIARLWPPWGALSPPNAKALTVEGRPILNLSLAVNHAISGDAVWSYHAVNVAIHLLAALCLFGIVRRTLEPRPAAGELAWAAALVWAMHPLQTEAVTYVIQRAESLMGLFYLLTLYAFIRLGKAGRYTGYWAVASVGCCALGMATKEVMVSAPVIVLLYDRTFVAGSFARACRARPIYYGALASTWLLLAYQVVVVGGGNRSSSAGFNVGVGWQDYWLTQGPALLHYLRLAVLPYPLVFDYGSVARVPVTAALPAAIAVLVLLAAAAVALYWRPAWGFLGILFFALLAPTSFVPGTAQAIVEHRMYLALAPLLVALVCGAQAAAERLHGAARLGRFVPAHAVVWIAAVLAAAGGTLTHRRNADYSTALALWSDTVAKRPGNARARTALGNELAAVPRSLPDAIGQFEIAVGLDPAYADAHYNLANALARTPGRQREAISHYESAIRLKPRYAEAYNNLGAVLAVSPCASSRALACYKTALALDPDYAQAHYNLANLCAANPATVDEALNHYEAALRLNPNYAEAHNNFGVILEGIPGRRAEALEHYRSAVRLDPANPAAQENLSRAVRGAGEATPRP